MPSVFAVAATVVVLVNGQPVTNLFGDGPNTRYDATHRFETMEACQEHRNSDRFKLERQELTAMIVGKFDADHVPQVTITDACHEFVRDHGKFIDVTAGEKPGTDL
jgi:hypothetical protein